MNSERAEILADMADALRAPLSRVRLGAQRMGRGELSPLGAELVAELDQAVGELDARIDRLSEALRPRRSQIVPDCRGVFRETLERLAPMLEARGTPCDDIPSVGPGLSGDVLRVRRTTIELLRGVGRLQAGGRLRMELLDDPSGAGAGVCGVGVALESTAPIDVERRQEVIGDLALFGALEDAELHSPPDGSADRFRASLQWSVEGAR